ncbi:MAG: site-specific recombinase [Clostridiales bacterium]|nr:site-specific recombinase [Clostridiales bacterium]
MDHEIQKIIASLPDADTSNSWEKTAALYIRVSTEEQTELSPVTQLKLGIEYAASHHFFLPKEYIFLEQNGVSGRSVKGRAAFREMLALAKSKTPPFLAILVWRFSRFARNQEESIVYKKLLSHYGVAVISITEPLEEGPFGKLNERIIEWMDEYYSIRLSDEVLRGMKENARRGAYQSAPPIGYDFAGNKKPPTINEQEKSIILFIFQSYLEGYSYTQIARLLNDAGYHTKRGGHFEGRSISYILQNPFYIGKVRWNYYDRSHCCYRDANDIILADGLHAPIITESLFHEVSQRIKQNQTKKGSHDASYCKHWLSGLFQCAACKRTLTLSTIQKKGSVYQQFRCWGYTKGMCQSISSLSLSKATKILLLALQPFETNGLLTGYRLTNKSPQTEALLDTLIEINSSPLVKYPLPKQIRSLYELISLDSIADFQKANAIRSILHPIVFEKDTNTFFLPFYLPQKESVSCNTGDQMES